MRVRTAADLGLVVRDRRKTLGLDQKTLAEKAGVGRQWIVAVEKGKPRAPCVSVVAASPVPTVSPEGGHDGGARSEQ